MKNFIQILQSDLGLWSIFFHGNSSRRRPFIVFPNLGLMIWGLTCRMFLLLLFSFQKMCIRHDRKLDNMLHQIEVKNTLWLTSSTSLSIFCNREICVPTEQENDFWTEILSKLFPSMSDNHVIEFSETRLPLR